MTDLEVLIFTIVRRDAELTSEVLRSVGYRSKIMNSAHDLVENLPRAGAVILAEETLTAKTLEILGTYVRNQPAWSDVPFIAVISPQSTFGSTKTWLEEIRVFLQNVTLLEKPTRIATLTTVVRTALSSRSKQFELRKTLDDLAEAKRTAEEASRAKSSFLANMSHEIRTPLAAIVGFTGLLKDQNLPFEERMQFADIVARNGDQLSSLVNDILDLSKVEAGKLEIENAVFSLPSFLADTMSVLRPLVEKKGLSFVVEIRNRLPDLVSSDQTRIRQIIVNLVSNAAKFTEKGSVKVSISSETLLDEKTTLKLRVRDTGIGMSKEDQSRLFLPFSQADASTTRKFGGTGLGLVLSKLLAQALGGEVRLVASEPEAGSEFEFSVTVENHTSLAEVSTEAANLTNALLGMRILLAEDSPDNQLLMKRYLDGTGAQVTLADNGRQAIEFATLESFDVILMDVQMPYVDGLTASKKLRDQGYSKPIIALTAHAFKEERDRSLKAGCNDHLSKPVKRDLLIETLKSYL